jgi:hypothetical protein
MSFWKWSRTAANNATADGSINWAEGQAPSTVNDSARAVMAAAAKYRDDIAGAIVTAGTSAAYTLTSSQSFDTLAHMDGAMLAFTPHTTSGGTCTLNVDGLGAKPLRSSPSVELLAGVLVQGTPYTVTYNNSDGAFYLKGFFGAPGIPLGVALPYFVAVGPGDLALDLRQLVLALWHDLRHGRRLDHLQHPGPTRLLARRQGRYGRQRGEPDYQRRFGRRWRHARRDRRRADDHAEHGANAGARARRERSNARAWRERPGAQSQRLRPDACALV